MTQREFLDIVFALVPKEANTIMDAFDEYVESAQLGTNLAEAYDGFPAQVTIKNCHHCKINIYPSQTKYIDVKGSDT